MTVGATQLYDQAMELLSEDANTQWDAAGSVFYFVLAKSTYTPADTHTTVADLGVAGTDWINTGDGAPIDATTRAVNRTNAETFYDSADANFGSNVTVAAKYLVCVKGNHASPLSTDSLIFYVDLKTEGGEASSTASDFNVQAPANGWWKASQA